MPWKLSLGPLPLLSLLISREETLSFATQIHPSSTHQGKIWIHSAGTWDWHPPSRPWWERGAVAGIGDSCCWSIISGHFLVGDDDLFPETSLTLTLSKTRSKISIPTRLKTNLQASVHIIWCLDPIQVRTSFHFSKSHSLRQLHRMPQQMVWCSLISSVLSMSSHPSPYSSCSEYQILPAQTSKPNYLNSQMVI